MIDDRATCDVCGVENFEDRSHLHPPPKSVDKKMPSVQPTSINNKKQDGDDAVSS